MRFDTELRYLKGVGPARAAKLAEASVVTVEDLLYVLPFRYEDRRRFARIAELLAGGPDTTLDVTVESARLIRTRTRDGCFKAFRHNTWVGAAVFAGIVLDLADWDRLIAYLRP